MGDNQVINIVYISDDKYEDITATSIASLRENRDRTTNYHIYIILTHTEDDRTKKFHKLEDDGFDISTILYEVSDNKKEYEITGISASPAAIVKFCLGDILYFLDKVIYLDGDTLVQGDLRELYDAYLADNQYAAVVAEDSIGEMPIAKYLELLDSNLKYYFNSGVMVLNLKKIRTDGLKDKLYDYRRHGKNYFMDQDALNVVFNGNVEFISSKFNYISAKDDVLGEGYLKTSEGIDCIKTMYERIAEATVLHLIAANNAGKPWKVYAPYLSDLFVKYYNLSPFADECRYNLLDIKRASTAQYLFPFELVPQGSTIVIWGAGKVGVAYYKQLIYTHYCHVILWVDINWKKYETENVVAPEKIREKEYDYIVVATKRESMALEIRRTLLNMDVDNKKIVWRYPVVL